MPSFETVPCPTCSRSLRLPAEVIGQSLQCPLCRTTSSRPGTATRIEAIPEAADDIPLIPALPPRTSPKPRPPRSTTSRSSSPGPADRPPAAAFAPVAFIAFVVRDPRDELDGRYQAEVDAKGVHLWRGKGRVLTADRGCAARHRGGRG